VGRPFSIEERELIRRSIERLRVAKGSSPTVGDLVWRRPIFLIALCGSSATAAALLWLAAFLTPIGQRVDQAVSAAFTRAGAQPLEPRIEAVAGLADPRPFLVIGLGIVAFALVRRRMTLAALVSVILLAANVTTQGLKIAIPSLLERVGRDANYELVWPSGHATASMSLALCAVIVAGPRLRPAATMLGAGYAVAVGYALVASGSHLPSDVLGGYLVAGSFALLGAAGLSALEAGSPKRTASPARAASPIVAPAVGALGVVAVAGVAVLAKSPDSWELAQHAPAMAAGASIAALGVTLIAGLAVAVRH